MELEEPVLILGHYFCLKCGAVLLPSNWYPSHQESGAKLCKSCTPHPNRDPAARRSTYVSSGRREHHLAKYTSDRVSLKTETFLRYSADGSCVRCGFKDIRALSLDHINGGGLVEMRKINRRGGWMFYAYLRKKGYPPGYQVLCMNCQFIKRDENKECKSNTRRSE